jgi:hypothetical protein
MKWIIGFLKCFAGGYGGAVCELDRGHQGLHYGPDSSGFWVNW